jgi:hypothetical protein
LTFSRDDRFRLYHGQLVDIHNHNSIPPEALKDEYDYQPMPAESMPPIGPNLLMHFFPHPDHAAARPVLLRSIPKRKRDKLEPCPIKGSSVGWGLDVVTGPNEVKIFLYGLLGCFLSMLFGIVWTVVMSDIQGGFGVAGFMFPFLGLQWLV